jgi:DNA-binding NarL/FixJ family response regulator
MIVEDHADAREWAAAALRLAFSGVTVHMTGTVIEGRQIIANHAPALAIIDLSLPDGDGFELISLLSSVLPSSRSVVFTVYDDDAHISAALRAGASGYLLKSDPRHVLVEHLLALDRGELPLSPMAANVVKSRIAAPAEVELALRLTIREREVLKMVALGLTANAIADRLSISRNTVNTYLKRMYAKLSVSSRAEAAVLARSAGLMPHSNS